MGVSATVTLKASLASEFPVGDGAVPPFHCPWDPVPGPGTPPYL